MAEKKPERTWAVRIRGREENEAGRRLERNIRREALYS